MLKNDESIDVLIIGAGIAGLSLALYLSDFSQKYKIVLLAKNELKICNTSMSKGGIAAVSDFEHDSFQNHIHDTYLAGKMLGDLNAIKELVESAPESIRDLIDWGVTFDHHGGKFDLHQEAGHSMKRIFHHTDCTGKELHQKLLAKVTQRPQIRLLENTMALDFITEGQSCIGLKTIDAEGVVNSLAARIFVLATGGSGQLFASTTNASVATGDGIAMGSRIGLPIKDLAYFQFHPTAIYAENSQQLDLLTEALRGFGAHIVDHKGERFLFRYNSAGEMANRAVVSQAIFSEMNQPGQKHVFLRLSHLNHQELNEKFPSAIAACEQHGFNPFEDDIPIIPAAHYQCGGLVVALNGKTTFSNIYAIGECADTGVHGANRLASNSLLEANVFAKKASRAINNLLQDETNLSTIKLPELTRETRDKKVLSTSMKATEVDGIRRNLQSEMLSIYLGNKELSQFSSQEEKWQQTKAELEGQAIKNTFEGAELRNMIEFALLFLKAQYNSMPDTSDKYSKV